LNDKTRDLLRRYSGSATFSFSSIENLDVNSKGWDDETLLHMVSRQGIVADVETLIEAGADVNARAEFNTTPLDSALGAIDQIAALAIVKLLLAAGADPNTKNEFGLTPIAQSTRRGWVDIADEIRSAGGIR
jgi:ankyrin repeat protein